MAFSSGSTIAGSEVQTLYNLAASKCSEGGVTGPSAGVGVHASGQLITAANTNDLVAAYQRAWNASGNKPGTQQSQVAVGDIIAAARYQAMSDQLNTMVFGTGYNGSGYAARFIQIYGQNWSMTKPAASWGGTATRYNYTISAWYTTGRRYNMDQYADIISTTNGGEGLCTHRNGGGPGIGTVEVWLVSGNYYASFYGAVDDGWNHVVVNVDTTNGTATERIKVWLNGNRLTAYRRANWPPQNQAIYFLGYQGQDMEIGGYGASYLHDGMLAELVVSDGYNYDWTAFASQINGIHMPKAFTGAYGPRGFLMQFYPGQENIVSAGGNTSAWTRTTAGQPCSQACFPCSTLPSIDHQFAWNMEYCDATTSTTELKFYEGGTERNNFAMSHWGMARNPIGLNDDVTGESADCGSYCFSYGDGGNGMQEWHRADFRPQDVGSGITSVKIVGNQGATSNRTWRGAILSKKAGQKFWRPRAVTDWTDPTGVRAQTFSLSDLPYWNAFANWDEATPTALADGSTAVCVFNGGASANQVTYGPANWGVTQVGGFPGAITTPWGVGRGVTNDNGNHYFNTDPAMWNWAMGNRNQFTFLMKFSQGANPAGGSTNVAVMESTGYGGFVINLNNNRLQFDRDSGGYNAICQANGSSSGWYSVSYGGTLDGYGGPIWLGMWSRSDGIWAGISVGNEHRPVCHDGWMFKRQLFTSRQTFSTMSGGYNYMSLFNGYGTGTNYGMRDGVAHYFILSQAEYYNN